MPKRLRQQRRGKGTITFRAPSFRFKYASKYREIGMGEEEIVEGKVINIVNDPARTAPIMVIKYKTGEEIGIPATYGIKVGDIVSIGAKSPVAKGNVLPLKSIPDGTVVYNIELAPGDGGKAVKTSGNAARIVGHEKDKVIVRFPSKAFKVLDSKCRATIGTVAGFGRKEKPIVKAGKNWHIQKARGKYWPMVSGVAMNAVSHPFGGKRRSTQKKLKTISARAPPGRKVGSIGARQTGRRTKKR